MSTKKTSPGKQRLLDFLKRLLEDDNDIIVWTDRQNAEFRMVKPHAVAEKWGAITGNPSMNYDKMSRGLRHFYTNNTLKKRSILANIFDVNFIESSDPYDRAEY
uniref:ETS domain-containing protein n=1 Tax=Caenorhabditis japonica TaxID=281687 RepID=A0A8R1HY67_CAEJA